MKQTIYFLMLFFAVSLASCTNDEDPIVIQIEMESSYSMAKGDQLEIVPKVLGTVNPTFKWSIDGEMVSSEPSLKYSEDKVGEYKVKLSVVDGDRFAEKDFVIKVLETDKFISIETEAYKMVLIDPELQLDGEVDYQWSMDGEASTLYSLVGSGKTAKFITYVAGDYKAKLVYSVGDKSYLCSISIKVKESSSASTAYITKVLDFMPAVGQFTNQLPKYVEGDTQEKMNEKVLKVIGNNKKGMISLGGFGGYVVVGFDHTIMNVAGKRDFRVIANAFLSDGNPDPDAPEGGSCEAGVIMVAHDINQNGVPDDDEWYEIAGSSHVDPTKELWYNKALTAGNDVKTYFNYEITYHRPAQEPTTEEDKLKYIRWEDNKNNSGYKVKNAFYNQCYYPLWAQGDKITFKGTRLPQNGIDESGEGSFFVVYKFLYGYADNELNNKDEAAIDIDWAVNSKGEKVKLPGVDFIKIYTGVNQENGWIGECSTEVTSVEDLHILGVDIDTRK